LVTGLRTFFKSDAFSPSCLKKKVMIPVEARLQEELRDCAVELRQLAYTLHNGIGEHDLLRLSERMRAAADGVVRRGA
jgi:hypothetical protein